MLSSLRLHLIASWVLALVACLGWILWDVASDPELPLQDVIEVMALVAVSIFPTLFLMATPYSRVDREVRIKREARTAVLIFSYLYLLLVLGYTFAWLSDDGFGTEGGVLIYDTLVRAALPIAVGPIAYVFGANTTQPSSDGK